MTRSSAREWAAPLLPTIAVFVFLILPWLNPFSPGPSPAVMPWLLSLGCFALVLLWAARVPLAKVAASAWLAAALLSAVLGLLQYFGATAPFGIWVNNPGIGEAFANLRQRNQFATLLNMGLVALLWWVAQDQAASPDSISKSFMSRRRAADSAIACPLLPVGIDGGQGETTTTRMIWKWNTNQRRPNDSMLNNEANKIKPPPSRVRSDRTPVPSNTEETLANTTSESMMSEVALALKCAAPY